MIKSEKVVGCVSSFSLQCVPKMHLGSILTLAWVLKHQMVVEFQLDHIFLNCFPLFSPPHQVLSHGHWKFRFQLPNGTAIWEKPGAQNMGEIHLWVVASFACCAGLSCSVQMCSSDMALQTTWKPCLRMVLGCVSFVQICWSLDSFWVLGDPSRSLMYLWCLHKWLEYTVCTYYN